jgi:hypothetical protein
MSSYESLIAKALLGDEKPKIKPPRALSISQIVANKEHSDRTCGNLQAMYASHGLASDSVVLIDMAGNQKPFRARKTEHTPDQGYIDRAVQDWRGMLQRPSEAFVVTSDREPELTDSGMSPVAFRFRDSSGRISILASAPRVLTCEKIIGKTEWIYNETNQFLYGQEHKSKNIRCVMIAFE